MTYTHDAFITTGRHKLKLDSFPMRLFQKAKKLGAWDPVAIDLSVDHASWQRADDEERDGFLGTVSVFQAGEEGVTLDLLPLIMAVAREGRLEEEMYLTTFLYEEAKHTEFFARWLQEVAGVGEASLEEYHTPSYQRIFYQELPQSMWALQDDPSPENQIRASVTYNMIVEGVLAETGYFGFAYYMEHDIKETGELHYPGMVEGLRLLRQDESRHLAYGIYLISRLVAAEPKLWAVAEARMTELLPLAMGFLSERMQQQIDRFGALPYDIDPQIYLSYATSQYQKRMERLQKARTQSLDQVEQVALDIEADAA